MPITVKHRVNFYDTDAMAVVHHANYIRWFEIGRVEYLRSIGITLDQMMEDGYVFPITDVSAKYVSPGHFDEELLIEVTPTALTKAKMAFEYRVLDVETGRVLVLGHTQNVYTSKETGHIERLSDKYWIPLKAAMAKEKALKAAKAEASAQQQ